MANVRAMGGPDAKLGATSISANGTYTAASENLDGFNTVEVNVPQPAVGEKFIYANGTYNSQTLDNMYGYREVQVLVPQQPLLDKSITANGEYIASDEGYYGYGSVNVNVPPNVGSKNITANGQYNAAADGYDGYDHVNVSVPSSAVVGPKTITTNGTYYANQEVPALDGFNQVTVNVPLGTKSITQNGTYNAYSDSVAGYSQVTVDVPPTSNIEIFPYASVAGGTTPTYQTKGRAVAIWQSYGRTDAVGFYTRTNVNPTTGEINNNAIYMSQNGATAWTLQSGVSFTVTDTTITTSALSSNARLCSLGYTY